ncbi:hypothetical protein BH11PLA2_BH11PLA2_11750 [soil metagenome]
MHPMNTTRRLLLAGLAAFVGGSAIAQPPAKAPPVPDAAAPQAKAADVRVGKNGELLVPLGGIVRFTPKLPKPFKDVLTSNDAIVTVRPDADPASVQLVGQTPGVTKLTFTLIDDTKGEFEVVVQPDYELLKKVIAKAVPTASIEVIPGVGNSIILSGYVNRPEDSETVLRIASAATGNQGAPAGGAAGAAGGSNIINAIQVGGLQHVQIEVTFASVDRSLIRNFGVNLGIAGSQGSFLSTLFAGGAGLAGAANSSANLAIGIVPAGFSAALQALKNENIAKVLTEPKVVTQSGRPAVIRSGGQQAVLSATGGGLGSISVSLEQIGTQMSVLPIVYGNGKIYLEVAPSVRTVNNGLGIQTSAGFSPGFSEQSVQSSVMLESGQTFAIGGLIQNTMQATTAKVPVLGEIPYAGVLFRASRMEDRESELVILVTPRLVDALDCAQVPKRVPGRETRSPDDYEFILEGIMEAPRGQRQVWNGRCYQAAYKCDPTYGIFPCKGNVCGANGNCGATGGATGNCKTCTVPTTLPATNIAPAPVAPMIMPAPAVAPAPLPAATNTVAPVAPATPSEPIVMPQQGTLVTPPITVAPVTETTAPSPLAAPIAVPEAVPGPVTPVEVPAPAPIVPEVK